MCGIAFIIGDLSIQDEKIFREMLIFDQVRGFDSVGMFGVPKYLTQFNNVRLEKDTCSPGQLFEKTKFFQGATFNLLLGHNRAATKGSISVANAHPFDVGNIVGVHNGSLASHKHLANVEVDSEALFMTIEAEGVEETFKKVYNPGALVWWDKTTMRMNVLRTNNRPLHYAFVDKKLYVLSEKDMLEFILARADKKNFEVKSFAEDTWYMFDPKKLEEGGELVSETFLLKEKGEAPRSTVVYNWGDYNRDWWSNYQDCGEYVQKDEKKTEERGAKEEAGIPFVVKRFEGAIPVLMQVHDDGVLGVLDFYLSLNCLEGEIATEIRDELKCSFNYRTVLFIPRKHVVKGRLSHMKETSSIVFPPKKLIRQGLDRQILLKDIAPVGKEYCSMCGDLIHSAFIASRGEKTYCSRCIKTLESVA